jgi:hypothetical protein
VGSGVDTCLMALYGSWVVEVKEGIVATACSKARVFQRHAHALPRRLQNVRADGVIKTCKPCGQALQHRAIVHHRIVDHSQAWCYSITPCSRPLTGMVGRGYNLIGRATLVVVLEEVS